MTVEGEEEIRRGPGRPRQTDEELTRIRELILSSTEAALGRYGYRGVTVMRIIEGTDITRPNFYRYYANAREPVEIVIERVSAELLDDITTTVARAQGGSARVVAGIDAYLAWSSRSRHLLPWMIADLHDPASPMYVWRVRVLDALNDVLSKNFLETGRPQPERTTLDIFVNAVEYTCHRLYLDTPADEAAVQAARGMMLRIAMAVLGGPRSWTHLAEHTDIPD